MSATLTILRESDSPNIPPRDSIEHMISNLSALAPTKSDTHVYLVEQEALDTHRPAKLKANYTPTGVCFFDSATKPQFVLPEWRRDSVILINVPFFETRDKSKIKHLGMPAEAISPILFTLCHEWGHAYQWYAQPEATYEDYGWASVPWWELKHKSRIRNTGMSRYGRTDPREAYAEAFAEWFLTCGKTENKAARTYADRRGWHSF